jgi:hypothetical protein
MYSVAFASLKQNAQYILCVWLQYQFAAGISTRNATCSTRYQYIDTEYALFNV